MLEFLNEILEKQYGNKLKDEIINGYSEERISSFRVNMLKSSVHEIEEILSKENINYEKVKWNIEAFVIEKDDEIKIKEHEIYANGKIYFQSLSSMLPPIILNPQQGKDILDMTAAPGGKTTQIASITDNKANITACERNKERLERLKYNLQKQGVTSCFTMQMDARDLDDFLSFDQILLDAPCSGSGTLNFGDKNIEKRISVELIEKCKKVQEKLLKKALKLLKPGCEMVYSTCSILECENEQIVNKCLKGFNAEIVPIDFEGIEDLPILSCEIEGTLLVKPTKYYEGFFVAKIRKNP